MLEKAEKIRQSRNDNVKVLLNQMERARRRTSRLNSLGVLPEEVAVKVLGYILSIREELLACQLVRRERPS